MSGSLRARGAGAWQLVVEAAPDPITGRRRQIYRTFHGTKKAATEALARLVLEAGRGDYNGHEVNVGQLIDAYLHQATLAVTTRADYDSVRRIHLPAAFAAMPVWKVRPYTLDAMYAALRDRGVSATRIHRLHDVLSVSFAQAVKWGWVTRSPTRDASPPPRPRRDLAPPGPDDFDRLLAAADGDFAVWLRLAILTGARRGEINGLQWVDVDLDTASVTIKRSIAYTVASGVVVKETKTNRARTITIDLGTVAALGRHRRRAVERVLAIGASLAPTAYLFARDLDGKIPWRPDYPTKRYDTLRQAVGITTRLHDLRHGHVTQLLGAGIDVGTVAHRVGHAKTSTTLDIYGHAIPARDREASNAMAGLLAEH